MKMHIFLTMALASTWWGQLTSGRNPVCDDLIDPFEKKIFEGVSLNDCEQKCLESYYFHCESILYNKKGKRCILSEKTRDAAPIQCAGSQYEYQYYQRPEKCGLEDITNKIMSCSATNFRAGFECRYTYDGSEHGSSAAGAAWATDYNKGPGQSMRVNLNDDFTLTAVHILPRCYKGAQVSDWALEFDNGEIIDAPRACGGSNSWTDCSGYGNDWQIVKLPHPIRTSYVNFQIAGTCGAYYNGMRELKLFGYDD